MLHLERLKSEYQNLRKERKYLYFAKPKKSENGLNLLEWECGIPGPDNSLYKNSYYRFTLKFTDKYPLQPPSVKFLNFVYHPNIYDNGSVCLDIIGHKWKPGLSILNILNGVSYLLSQPNPNSPANGTVCSVFCRNKKKYEENVRENIRLYHSKLPW